MRRSLIACGLALVASACGGGGGGGGGGFGPSNPWYVAGAAIDGQAISVDEFWVTYVDGDGRPDLLIAGPPRDSGLGVAPLGLQAAFGRADGGFDFGYPNVGGTDRDVNAPAAVLGRFDLDPFPDVAYFRELGGQSGVVLCHGRGDGTYAVGAGSPVPLGTHATMLAVAEMNGDAFDDLVFGDHGVGIGVLLSNGAGGFGPPIVVLLPNAGELRSVAPGDVDWDGDLDVVVLQQHGRLTIAHNDGAGNLTLATNFVTESLVEALIVDDASGPQFVAVFGRAPVPHVTIYPRDANGSFELSTSHRIDLADGFDVCVAMRPVRPALDGGLSHVAVIARNGTTSELALFLVRPETTSQLAERLQVRRGQPLRLAVGDLNFDDAQDLVLETGWSDADGSGFHLETLLSRGR